MKEHRGSLTPPEKLRVAMAVLINDIDQHHVAALMGVNSARINEAVKAVRKAIDWPSSEAHQEQDKE